ncbi:hypothetical protein XELAEV_18038837mg [Xenopus laevis]|uniref:Uncharacterized protein n=1 Tax=Xenopus laevis TaxID=8355 RepID=A0A974C6R2_XENLA|nr:hypothetical protein XELAEV_18038837mg [Xenopus laevis]
MTEINISIPYGKTFVNQAYHPQVIDDQIQRATHAPYRYRLKQIFTELSLLSYRQPPNLRKMIVPKTTKAGTFPCNSNRCETCKYILCKDQVAILNTQKVYYSCASSNVVYMITCTRCSTGGIYIRETGQKYHHRYKINTKSCDTPVGQHFCSQNHSLQDMQVLILKLNLKTEQERKIYKFKCMKLFNTLRQGLNLGSGFVYIFIGVYL